MKFDFLDRWYKILIILVITVAILIFAKQLLIPLTCGLFLSLGLSPVVERFKKWGVPRVLGILATFIVGIAIIGGIGYTIGFAVNDFADNIPTYRQNVDTNILATKNLFSDKFAWGAIKTDALLQDTLDISSWGGAVAKNALRATGNAFATIGLTIVLSFFMLLYRERIKKFFTLVADKNHQEEIGVVAHKSFKVLPNYILGLMLVIVIMTGLNTFGFWLIGIPSPLFWGIMVSLLNIIPYVGTLIGFGGVTLFALLVSGPTTALFAVIMFLIIQFVDNNFLTPKITGGQISINPLAAIISIIIWGMIWGVVGMILALPILGLIKIICDTIPQLQPFGYLLGDRE